ncbi:Ion transport 2 domain protein [Thalassoporum mexicanum PCC 7367]|uniref:potassium channel family protein n=1 Tax=Thalassoporum mexicanum TaxID=3457544 RepID=UPI00029FC5B2|nr:potassium channel protein [Pseudanabaena sp. PCC 7367]AFY69213.1 Ion transport 2 domain protein [Pseudanabaena sp. PCC 7367]
MTKKSRSLPFTKKRKASDQYLGYRIAAIWKFLERENILRLLCIIGVLVIISSFALAIVEPEISIHDAWWWSVVTVTTVGYGDISPSTPAGRLIAIFLMFLGIGLLATFSATIASVLVDKKLKEELGMSHCTYENHIVLCEWNHRMRSIWNEFRYDYRTALTPMVLIADMERKPVEDDNLFFIQGQVDDATLERANLSKAKTVIVLGDDRLEDTPRDAKVVLTTLTIESMNPSAYTIVELVNDAYIKHCERANADEIIVSSTVSSGLISQAALNHGITKVVCDILNAHYGNRLYKMPVPKSMVDRPFVEALTEIKREHEGIVLAVHQGGPGGEVISNPNEAYLLKDSDSLIVMARDSPNFGRKKKS